MRVRFPIVLAIAAAALNAQTRPESGSMTRAGNDQAGALMARLRAGDKDVEALRVVVTGLLEGENAVAAPWWIALFSDDAKLLPAERDVIAKLRRAVERPEAFAEERRWGLRLIRHVESLIASKQFEDARGAAAVARVFLGLVPDPALAKLLDAAEKKLPEDVLKARVKKVAWPQSLEAETAAACRRLIEAGLRAYVDAGCRPGRLALNAATRNAAAILPYADVFTLLGNLRALVPRVEPGAALVVLVRTTGGARFFLEGVPLTLAEGEAPVDAETHEPVTIAALPGDLVTISFDTPYASDELGRSFVIAFNGRFETHDLATKDLFCDLSEDPVARRAELRPAPIAKKLSNPPQTLFGRGEEQDQALRAFNTYFELPKTTKRSVDVPCLGDMIMFLKEFETRRLAPTLIGTEADRFALVIKVPE